MNDPRILTHAEIEDAARRAHIFSELAPETVELHACDKCGLEHYARKNVAADRARTGGRSA